MSHRLLCALPGRSGLLRCCQFLPSHIYFEDKYNLIFVYCSQTPGNSLAGLFMCHSDRYKVGLHVPVST